MKTISLTIPMRVALYACALMQSSPVDAAVMQATTGIEDLDELVTCTFPADMLDSIARRAGSIPEGAAADHNKTLLEAIMPVIADDAELIGVMMKVRADNIAAKERLEDQGKARVDDVRRVFDLNQTPAAAKAITGRTKQTMTS